MHSIHVQWHRIQVPPNACSITAQKLTSRTAAYFSISLSNVDWGQPGPLAELYLFCRSMYLVIVLVLQIDVFDHCACFAD